MIRTINPLLLLLALVFGLAGCSPVPTPAAPPTPTLEPPPSATPLPQPSQTPTAQPSLTATPVVSGETILEISGPGGSKSLSMADLQRLPVTEGQAGMKSSTGKITVPALYAGITLQELAALVGGMDESMGVNVVAEDGYAMTLSYNQITKGEFIAYDPATGDEKKIDDPLTVILAYAHEGQPLLETSDGKLRLVIISPRNNQVTDGHWSVKWVNKIRGQCRWAKNGRLRLDGVIQDVIDRNSFQSCGAPGCHQATWTDDKAQVWAGVPLWLLAGRVDDAIKHDGPAYLEALADAGYSIEIVATDGYTITLDSVRVKRNNNILVAYQVNDNPLPDKYFPLRLVGDEAQKNEMIGAIDQINLIIDPALLPLTVEGVTPTAYLPSPRQSVPDADLTIDGAGSISPSTSKKPTYALWKWWY